MDESPLEERCLALIDEHAAEVLDSKGFLNLRKETLKRILKRDSLQVEETRVYKACAKWTESECRRQALEVSAESRFASSENVRIARTLAD